MELLDKLVELKHVSIHSQEISRVIFDHIVEHEGYKLEEPLLMHFVLNKIHYIMDIYGAGVYGYITNYSLIAVFRINCSSPDHVEMLHRTRLYKYSESRVARLECHMSGDDCLEPHRCTDGQIYEDITFEMFLPKATKSARTRE
jgi:hypothetical protein